MSHISAPGSPLKASTPAKPPSKAPSIVMESPECTISEQQELYGEIRPAPSKNQEPKSLPPLQMKLVLPKKRASKRSGSDDLAIRRVRSHKIPMKQARNFSTPLPHRVPSLVASPIPDLSPQTSQFLLPAKITSGSSVTTTPISTMTANGSSPIALRSFSSPSADLRSSGKVPVQVQLNQLLKSTYVGESERQLRREIVKYEHMVTQLQKIKARKERQARGWDLEKLVDKWRGAAIAASNYLLNGARVKIDRMGGIEEFRRRQKEAKLRKLRYEYDSRAVADIEAYMETDAYKALGKYEKEEVQARKKEVEQMGEKMVSEAEEKDEGEEEYTMKELYAELHLDYESVYGK